MVTPRSTFVAPAPLCDKLHDTIQMPNIEFPSDCEDNNTNKANAKSDNGISDTTKQRRRRPARRNSTSNVTASTKSKSKRKNDSQKIRQTSMLSSRTASTVSTVSNTSSNSSASARSITVSSLFVPTAGWTKKSKVWFGNVHVNEHPYELGDNPSVSDGAPLTISWKSQQRTTYEVEYYETYNPSEKRRTAKTGLKLSAGDRHRLLLSAGYTMAEVVACGFDIQRQRKKREESVRNKKWDNIHETIESTKRKLRGVTRRRGSFRSSSPAPFSRSGGTTRSASPSPRMLPPSSSILSSPPPIPKATCSSSRGKYSASSNSKMLMDGRLGSSMSALQLDSPTPQKKSSFKRGASTTSILFMERMNSSSPQLQWVRN
eukprot:CAMPEP_0119547946 /NCGR_PEP_ID=MMETSP1352-20130426/1964_1 /TAXON_ID=265584 /ORGANISM="Stauroneis constricta, Strain CCMP1120" /LENGTH=373 /DNA_ID=CAMNT_0007593055 /DNA_START=531 /DNA_END=1652 /DNA_ORIENTATION=+